MSNQQQLLIPQTYMYRRSIGEVYIMLLRQIILVSDETIQSP